MNDDRDYEVGYGKPPQSTRFTKGRSGNPNGRPKGARNFSTLFREVTQETIPITEGGKRLTITKIEAVVRQLTTKAMHGDMAAIREMRAWEQICKQAFSKQVIEYPDREKDAAVMQRLLKRLQNGANLKHEDDSKKRDEQ